jgi:hypothetical protein
MAVLNRRAVLLGQNGIRRKNGAAEPEKHRERYEFLDSLNR